MRGKIIFNLAMSLDGYIADQDGGFGWINGDGDKTLDTEQNFDFDEFTNNIDIIVMGRKCFEEAPTDNFKDKRLIVATSKQIDDYDNFQFVNSDITEYVKKLSEQSLNIWIFGGGLLADSFIKQDLIDEYIVGIIPVILGSGRPLFFEGNPMIELHLDSYTINEGVPILRYSKR